MKPIKIKHLIAGIVCAIALGTSAQGLIAQSGSTPEEARLIFNYKRANPLYLEGEKLLLRNKMEKADKKFLECIAIMPEHADAYYALAKIYLIHGELAKALDSVTIAKKNYASLANFQSYTKQQYMDRLRSRRQALDDHWRTLQEEMTSLPETPSARAASQAALDQISRDIELIDKSLNSPVLETYEIPADYFFINGNVLFKMGKLTDAAAQYREAIRIDPGHNNSYNNLASVSFAMGKYREALEWLTRAEIAGAVVNPEFKKAVENKISTLK